MSRWWIAVGLAIALLLALASPLASPHPDGLERVAEDQGFAEAARDAPLEVMGDYLFPGIENEALATILAGLLGTLLLFGLLYGLGRLMLRRRTLAG
jgi:hypothetical protein